jgi:hypothetical protein
MHFHFPHVTKHLSSLFRPSSRSLNHQLTPPTAQQINSSNTPTTNNMMNRPASAYFNNNNVMNQSPSNPNIPSTQSTSTGNLMQSNQTGMMVGFNQMSSPAQAPHTHISHPNLSGPQNPNLPIMANRPPMLPNKMMPQQQPGGNFMRESQSQHSLRMNQQQMMAPSMPNIAQIGYANNIPASQSMQNMNQMPGNYPMFHPQQAQFQEPPQQFQNNPQLSPNNQHHPHQQASLLRGNAKMAEMGEMLKRQQQQRTQQMVNGGPMHFANSMDNIHIPTNQMMSPAQNFHPQSPQKQLPPTAPKPQVKFLFLALLIAQIKNLFETI